jgi:carboxyl-terminal processing protease
VQKLFFLLALCATLAACGGGGSGPDLDLANPETACSADVQRVTLSKWLDSTYYWNTQLTGPDSNAAGMDAYFHSMLPNPPDRYSFTQSTESFDQLFTSGFRYGYGYVLVRTLDGALRVRSVEPMSPVAALGMRRGDRVVSIDGFTPDQIVEGAVGAVTQEGILRNFVLADESGAQRTLGVHSRLFRVQPVANWQVLDATRGGRPVKVGYLVYNQFVQYSTSLLGFVVEHMAWDGVSEMVLDLRYNGGGAVITARDLASMLSGSQTDGAVFTHLKFNANQSSLDQDLGFQTAAQRFAQPIEGLKRLVVITSGGTASASELVINGLKPFMQVVLVGENTYGKPYGFLPRNDCGTTYNAVNFEAVNAQGVGGYSEGMPVDCYAADDLDHELGDPKERRLATALAYIDTGRCQTQAPQSAPLALAKKPREFGDVTPPQMHFSP